MDKTEKRHRERLHRAIEPITYFSIQCEDPGCDAEVRGSDKGKIVDRAIKDGWRVFRTSKEPRRLDKKGMTAVRPSAGFTVLCAPPNSPMSCQNWWTNGTMHTSS